MKILLDECVTRKLKKQLSGYDVQTVTELDLSGVKNGKLLAVAEEMGFEVLLTIDKNIDYQQKISKFNLTLVVFDAVNSNIKYLAPLVPSFLEQVIDFEKGKTYIIF